MAEGLGDMDPAELFGSREVGDDPGHTKDTAALRDPNCVTTSTRMDGRDRWRKFLDNPVVEWAMFVLGVLLLAFAVVSGPIIPGPNGVLFAAAGLSLILKSSLWAKRHYARLKKKRVKIRGRHIVIGEWTDWALRRQSAKRRKEVAEAKQEGGSN